MAKNQNSIVKQYVRDELEKEMKPFYQTFSCKLPIEQQSVSHYFKVWNTGFTTNGWFLCGPQEPTISYNPNHFSDFETAFQYAVAKKNTYATDAKFKIVEYEVIVESNKKTTIETTHFLEI